MSIRREPTYLSTDVWSALLIVSKSREVTPDELANDLLDGIIKERWPSVVAYQNEVNKLRKEILKTLGTPNDTNINK